MAIIRKTIIEPIEFISIKKGFLLIHASVFKHYNKTFVVVAASKAGKSTIVSKLSCLKNIEILSDNYCLIKGNKIKTIEEPFRSGDPKRSQVTFYGRTITGRPNLFEGEVDFIIYLNRGDENSLKKITCLQMQNIIREINNLEKEGVGHLSPLDPIKIDEQKVELCNELKYYSLNIAEGIENVEVAINQLINLK